MYLTRTWTRSRNSSVSDHELHLAQLAGELIDGLGAAEVGQRIVSLSRWRKSVTRRSTVFSVK